MPRLTPKQKEVLCSISRGLTDRDIAKQLGIRQDTVNDHVSSILEKLNAAMINADLDAVQSYSRTLRSYYYNITEALK